MTARNKALKIIALLQGKKAGDILLLDLRKASPISDFFVICTAHSPLHTQALADEVALRMKQANLAPTHVEGFENGEWVLIDFWDVVVHVFVTEVREFYGLERLWGDLPQRRFDDSGAG
jgi:ribosome-associated protein